MKEIADYALKLLEKGNVDYGEVRLESNNSSGFILKNGVPQIGGLDNSSGIGVRLIKNKAAVFFSTNILIKNKIRELVKKSFRTAEKGSDKKIFEITELGREHPHSHSYEVKEKIKLNEMSPDQKIKELVEIEKRLVELNIKMPYRFLSLSDEMVEKYLITTDGTKINSRIPRIGFYYLFTIISNSQSIQRSWQYGSTGGFEHFNEWNLESKLRREALALKKVLEKGVKPPKKPTQVIVGPEVVGIMVHESVGHPYEADRILGRESAQAGKSFVKEGMLNSRIGSSVVNVSDDPSIKNSYGYYLFDDEGVKAEKKFLIKEGCINEFLHNRQTSRIFKQRNNGSARAAGFDKEPIIRMSNTFLENGDYSEEELISTTKKGVYMRNFMEWNIDDLRLNQKYRGAEAYLIENGEITNPVKSPVIEISTPKLYSSFAAIANNLEFHAGSCGKGEPMQGIPVWFGGPSAKLINTRVK